MQSDGGSVLVDTNNGFIFNLEEAEYHAAPGLSSTGAKKILQSPAHYQSYINSPRIEKSEFDLGSAVHSKLLGVGAQITVYPDGDGPETFEFDGQVLDNVLAKNGAISTSAAKAFAEEARTHGLIPVKRVTGRVVNLMAESVLANQTARALLEGGDPEVSMFYTDPDLDVLSRGRLDYLKPNAIVDVKTTSGDASEGAFARQVFNLGYEVQAAHYEHIYEGITGQTLPWLWVVVESHAPYLANVFTLGSDEWEMGRARARLARERYARARESNRWTGYENKTGGPIGMLKAPVFSIYDYQDQMEGDAA